MKNNKFQCDGCGRNCYITLQKDGNEYYIEGNTCIGGEEYAKEQWPFLKSQNSLQRKEKKKGIFKKLFRK
ncbi:hypothetical protein GOQ27_03195 [Clostridium sp. D2Q-11]|uniref:Uncharacterized protein n=1 Tax=Anaeromonas frigoriresistens TaxID=2683708 RepID=A0A942UT30_9FIRM|nr:hypothetical protein [Anaeromonas frigoriresistens]MBS4537450.1 hypothetical protein [Anaeromonas frigoriresistens]